MMEKGYAEKMKDVMQSVYEMADNLDAKGVGANIPFVNKAEGLRGAIKTDILLFLLRLTDHDKRINRDCREYINDCLDYDFSELTLELSRKKANDANLPHICALLPYFILLDKQLGGNKVITFCGSTRFKDEFMEAQKRLTLEGNIVISVDLFGHSGDNEVWENMDEGMLTATKKMLDDMHKWKIDMADEIFVINVGGYIGESTRSEIEYAAAHGKIVRYLENEN